MIRATLVVGVVLWAISTLPAQVAVDSSFQVRYASNLTIGDSVVNITNSGATGHNICVNVYTFSPDEQLISCCSCRVTPNALRSLSVKNDLISNTLTPAVPDSVVIKLLSTTNAGSTCNAGTPASTATLATGLLAWGTTLHATPVTGTYSVTETAFAPATLSATERSKITSLCAFIQANGSGFGICRSCQLGGVAPVQ